MLWSQEHRTRSFNDRSKKAGAGKTSGMVVEGKGKTHTEKIGTNGRSGPSVVAHNYRLFTSRGISFLLIPFYHPTVFTMGLSDSLEAWACRCRFFHAHVSLSSLNDYPWTGKAHRIHRATDLFSRDATWGGRNPLGYFQRRGLASVCPARRDLPSPTREWPPWCHTLHPSPFRKTSRSAHRHLCKQGKWPEDSAVSSPQAQWSG